MKTRTLKHIVIGGGEVGAAIAELLCARIHDPARKLTVTGAKAKFLHICFPFSESFMNAVRNYERSFKAEHIVIHSTVPLGTSLSLGATHSPIRGIHPHLVKGIMTFVKYFGGPRASLAAQPFAEIGIKVKIIGRSKTTEALKLWDTTQYGLLICLNKYIHKWCELQGLDFDTVYTDANKTYNAGYVELGKQNVVRPHLKYVKGPIGGHCVLPNAKLINPFIFEVLNDTKLL